MQNAIIINVSAVFSQLKLTVMCHLKPVLKITTTSPKNS